MGKYKPAIDGEPVTIKYVQAFKVKGAVQNFACCDCGLVHRIVYIPLKTRLKIYYWRDNRQTANHRRGEAVKASIRKLKVKK